MKMSKIICKKCSASFETFNAELNIDTYTCPACGSQNSPGAREVEVPAPTAGLLAVTAQASTQDSVERQASDWETNWRTDPFGSLLRTAKAILTEPGEYFSTIRPFEDHLALAIWIYGFSFINFLFTMILEILLGSVGMTDAGLTIPMAMCGAVFGPFVAVALVYVIAGVIHFFMIQIGGSQKSYTTTLTVYGLSTVSHVFIIIPILGSIASLVYFIVINVVGMARAHEIPVSRSLLAILVPVLILCCCFGGLIGFAVVVAGALPSFLK